MALMSENNKIKIKTIGNKTTQTKPKKKGNQ